MERNFLKTAFTAAAVFFWKGYNLEIRSFKTQLKNICALIYHLSDHSITKALFKTTVQLSDQGLGSTNNT